MVHSIDLSSYIEAPLHSRNEIYSIVVNPFKMPLISVCCHLLRFFYIDGHKGHWSVVLEGLSGLANSVYLMVFLLL